MRAGLSLLAMLAACGGDNAAISIDGAPLVRLQEGEPVSLAVTVDGAPAGSDCAPPFDGDELIVRLEPDRPELFERTELVVAQGLIDLELEARCDAVEAAGADRLLDVVVESAAGCAEPGRLRLQLADQLGAACAPRVTAWVGDCSQSPAGAGDQVAVAANSDPGPLCVRVAALDAAESLWVRSESDLPEKVLASADLPAADGAAGEQTFTIPLGDTTHLRGRFGLDYHLSRAEPDVDPEAEAVDGTIELVIGDPGLAMDLASPAPDLVELDAGGFGFQIWQLPEPGQPNQPTCARASRTPPPVAPLPRAGSFLRLENPIENVSTDGSWLCGRRFTVRVSAPIDAPNTEVVRLEAAHCSGCGTGAPAPIGTPVVRDIDLAVTSVAEEVACDVADGDLGLQVACADVGGADDTPEVLFVSRGGSNPRACAWAGDADRLVAASWESGSTALPVTTLTLPWRDPIAGSVPLLLGRFAAAPLIRRLEVDAGPPSVARWVAATDLGIAALPIDLSKAVPMSAAPPDGATHLAFPVSARSVGVRCVSTSDPVITDCQSVTFTDVAPADHTIVDLGFADLDADSDLDLVVFATDDTGDRELVVVAVQIDWSDPGVPAEGTRLSVATGTTALRVRSARLSSCGPCADSLYAVPVLGGDEFQASMFRIRIMGGGLTAEQVPTPAAALSIARRQGHMLVGTRFGVQEAQPDPGGLLWSLRDPVLIEAALVGPLKEPPLGYGRALAPCVADSAAVAFTSDTGSVRFSRLDVHVDQP